jgi:hypothetical protein
MVRSRFETVHASVSVRTRVREARTTLVFGCDRTAETSPAGTSGRYRETEKRFSVIACCHPEARFHHAVRGAG